MDGGVWKTGGGGFHKGSFFSLHLPKKKQKNTQNCFLVHINLYKKLGSNKKLGSSYEINFRSQPSDVLSNLVLGCPRKLVKG